MKIIIKMFACIVFFFYTASSIVSADTINIAVGDFCPYQCDPEKEDGRIGFMSEITESIYKDAGHTINFTVLPFKRAISQTEEGVYDAVVCNVGHSKQLLFSKQRIGVLQQTFFVKKGDPWMYEGIESLESAVVASVLGYDLSAFSPEYEAYLKKNRHSNAVQYIGGENFILRNAKKILAGRVTTYNEDAGLFNYVTMKAGIGDEFSTAGILGGNSLYMGFSSDNPNAPLYVEIFDKGIKTLRESGELDYILSSYGVEDWENGMPEE